MKLNSVTIGTTTAPSRGNRAESVVRRILVIFGPSGVQGHGRVLEPGASCPLGRAGEGGPRLDSSDGRLSRRHAQLEPIEGGYQLVDLERRNGTFVNRERIEAPRKLLAGDVIRVGNHLLLSQELSAGEVSSLLGADPGASRLRWLERAAREVTRRSRAGARARSTAPSEPPSRSEKSRAAGWWSSTTRAS